VRPEATWGSAESQELAQVSPAMHREFALSYEARLLAPFVRSGYGCCEDCCSANGCHLEIILKDTHSCEFRPHRFDRWASICRDCIDRCQT